ncbi:MAG: DUF3164 family protein [Prevotellaceae bacterium]|nr:DUF3164 family protein [Prevotellaceae bacterium]
MENVTMTPEELEEFKAFQAEKAKRAEEERRKRARLDYAAMVDEEVRLAIPQLEELSEQMRTVKGTVYGNFDTILRIKAEELKMTRDNQRSHTFTTSDGLMRLTLGVNTVDGYRDTAEDGIAMVRGYIESLAKDENSRALVSAVLKLLSRDGQGNLKASRVLQLRKMADETGDPRFIEGVRIIEEAYIPSTTKQYIRAERKDEKGRWRIIPLSVTDCE